MAELVDGGCEGPFQYQTFKNVYELKLYIHSLQYSCVKAIDGELQVVDCYAIHNHTNPSKERLLPTVSFVGDGVKSREPDPEFLAVFRNLFEGREFHSYDELQKSMGLLSTKTGASYIRRHTTKLPPEDEGSRRCVYKRLLYECKHAGTFRSRATQGICRKSKMMNCPSRINFLYEGNGLRLVTFNLTHNHLLTPQATPVIPKKRSCEQFSPLPADSYCQPSNIASGIENGNSFPRLSAVFRDDDISRPVRTETFYTGDYFPNDAAFLNRRDDLTALGPVSWPPSASPHNNMSESVKRSNVMNLVDQLWDVASTSEPADLEEGANRLRELIDWWKKDGN
nr:unnamed protein product [Spirometra erinaceieuropaei]